MNVAPTLDRERRPLRWIVDEAPVGATLASPTRSAYSTATGRYRGVGGVTHRWPVSRWDYEARLLQNIHRNGR